MSGDASKESENKCPPKYGWGRNVGYGVCEERCLEIGKAGCLTTVPEEEKVETESRYKICGDYRYISWEDDTGEEKGHYVGDICYKGKLGEDMKNCQGIWKWAKDKKYIQGSCIVSNCVPNVGRTADNCHVHPSKLKRYCSPHDNENTCEHSGFAWDRGCCKWSDTA